MTKPRDAEDCEVCGETGVICTRILSHGAWVPGPEEPCQACNGRGWNYPEDE